MLPKAARRRPNSSVAVVVLSLLAGWPAPAQAPADLERAFQEAQQKTEESKGAQATPPADDDPTVEVEAHLIWLPLWISALELKDAALKAQHKAIEIVERLAKVAGPELSKTLSDDRFFIANEASGPGELRSLVRQLDVAQKNFPPADPAPWSQAAQDLDRLAANQEASQSDNADRIFLNVIDNLDRPEYFRLTDNGQARRVAKVLREEEAPLRLAIVLEEDNRGPEGAAHFFEGIVREILEKRLRPDDRYVLVTGGQTAELLHDFAQPREKLGGPLKRAGKGAGAPHDRDALMIALDKLKAESGPIKKVVLLLGYCPTSDPSVASWDQVVEAGKESNAQVFIVYATDNPQYRHPAMNLAGLTGGQTLNIDAKVVRSDYHDMAGRQAIERRLLEVFDSIKRELLLGYYLDPADAAKQNWRTLNVELDPARADDILRIKKKAGAHQISLDYPSQRYVAP